MRPRSNRSTPSPKGGRPWRATASRRARARAVITQQAAGRAPTRRGQDGAQEGDGTAPPQGDGPANGPTPPRRRRTAGQERCRRQRLQNSTGVKGRWAGARTKPGGRAEGAAGRGASTRQHEGPRAPAGRRAMTRPKDGGERATPQARHRASGWSEAAAERQAAAESRTRSTRAAGRGPTPPDTGSGGSAHTTGRRGRMAQRARGQKKRPATRERINDESPRRKHHAAETGGRKEIPGAPPDIAGGATAPAAHGGRTPRNRPRADPDAGGERATPGRQPDRSSAKKPHQGREPGRTGAKGPQRRGPCKRSEKTPETGLRNQARRRWPKETATDEPTQRSKVGQPGPAADTRPRDKHYPNTPNRATANPAMLPATATPKGAKGTARGGRPADGPGAGAAGEGRSTGQQNHDTQGTAASTWHDQTPAHTGAATRPAQEAGGGTATECETGACAAGTRRPMTAVEPRKRSTATTGTVRKRKRQERAMCKSDAPEQARLPPAR